MTEEISGDPPPAPKSLFSSLNSQANSSDFPRMAAALHSRLATTVTAERQKRFAETGEKHPDDIRREAASFDIFFGCPPISEILPGVLYLGDERYEEKHLVASKICTIVNCAATEKSDLSVVELINRTRQGPKKKRGLFSQLFSRGDTASDVDLLKLYEYGMDDSSSFNILNFLDEIVRIIDQPSHHPVFVRCAMGVSRSATVVFAYLMWKNKWNLDRAYLETMRCRNVVFPNPGFILQLLEFETKILGEEDEGEREQG